MEDLDKEYTLSLYGSLTNLKNSQKSNVYLVQNQISGKIYIKKELKTYNIDVYKTLLKINHRNTPKVYELIELDKTLYIIEEFINGNTLQEILKSEGPLNEERVIGYVLELCDILSVLHNRKFPIIHRDIKDSNIIISNDNVVKLIDFDVSRTYKEEGNEDTYILGTKGYASPEQFGFDQTDCRSDIYSLGVLMNVLTTGDYPKNKKNTGKLKNVIEKCTYIAAEKRYSNVIELKEELIRILDNEEEQIRILENQEDQIKIFENEEKNYEKYKINEELDEKNEFKQRENEIKQNRFLIIMRQIPGFRRKNPIIIFLASLWYLFLGFGILTTFENFSIALLLENISMVSMLLAMTFLNANFKDIKKRLPLLRSNNKNSIIVGLIIYNLILLFVGGGLLSFFQGFK